MQIEEIKKVFSELSQEVKKQLNTAFETRNEEIKNEMKKEVEKQLDFENEKFKEFENKLNNIEIKDTVEEKNFGFSNLGDFTASVAAKEISRNKGYTIDDKRLGKIDKYMQYLSTNKDLQDGIDNLGGFLVPTEFSNNLITDSIEQSNFVKDTTKVMLHRNSIEYPIANITSTENLITHGGIQFNWLDESSQYSGSQPSFKMLNLKLKKMGAMVTTTDEILEDNAIALESMIPKQFKEGFVYTLDRSLIQGNGVSKPLGILNADSLITTAIESGQSDKIVLENLGKMITKMPVSSQSKAKWYINIDMYPYLLALNAGTNGVPIFMRGQSLEGSPLDTLLGRPVVWTEHCSAVGSIGDIIFADFDKYIVATKANKGLEMSSSMHLKFDYDKKVFKFVYRIDGQPMYNEAFKSDNSSDKSYFVTLGAR